VTAIEFRATMAMVCVVVQALREEGAMRFKCLSRLGLMHLAVGALVPSQASLAQD
jgi:hypothetical protein